MAQMIGRKLPIILSLVHKNGYTIEVQIHDEPHVQGSGSSFTSVDDTWYKAVPRYWHPVRLQAGRRLIIGRLHLGLPEYRLLVLCCDLAVGPLRWAAEEHHPCSSALERDE